MRLLNFPRYAFRFKSSENKLLIFDEVRKKFVLLTPEEWVRQHVISFLIKEKKYPKSLINIEKKIQFPGFIKRYDAVVFKPDGSIRLLVECKAPEVAVTQETFDQTARYNLLLHAEYLMITNGVTHYYCQMDYASQKYLFLRELPEYTGV